jgi:hypothetical protein
MKAHFLSTVLTARLVPLSPAQRGIRLLLRE